MCYQLLDDEVYDKFNNKVAIELRLAIEKKDVYGHIGDFLTTTQKIEEVRKKYFIYNYLEH